MDNSLAINDKPTELQVIPGGGSNLMQSTVIGQNGQELVNILKKSIENVQANPNYIPQANAIREHIGEIINLAKVEAQTMVAVANLHSK
jgi:hypothetical protein